MGYGSFSTKLYSRGHKHGVIWSRCDCSDKCKNEKLKHLVILTSTLEIIKLDEIYIRRRQDESSS